MNAPNKNPRAGQGVGGEGSCKNRHRKYSKLSRVLAELYPDDSLNLFEAERIGDHCLNSTISTLANQYGFVFTRTREKVPNRFGSLTSCVRYRLAPESKDAARKFLEMAGILGGDHVS